MGDGGLGGVAADLVGCVRMCCGVYGRHVARGFAVGVGLECGGGGGDCRKGCLIARGFCDIGWLHGGSA